MTVNGRPNWETNWIALQIDNTRELFDERDALFCHKRCHNRPGDVRRFCIKHGLVEQLRAFGADNEVDVDVSEIDYEHLAYEWCLRAEQIEREGVSI